MRGASREDRLLKASGRSSVNGNTPIVAGCGLCSSRRPVAIGLWSYDAEEGVAPRQTSLWGGPLGGRKPRRARPWLTIQGGAPCSGAWSMLRRSGRLKLQADDVRRPAVAAQARHVRGARGERGGPQD